MISTSVLAVVATALAFARLSHGFRAETHRWHQSSSRRARRSLLALDGFSLHSSPEEPNLSSTPNLNSSSSPRRTLIKAVFGCALLNWEFGVGQSAVADDIGSAGIKKPYAPMEYLLPAARVRIYIDHAVETAQAMVDSQKRNDVKETERQLIAKLSALLLEPRQFMSKKESSTAKNYLEQETGEAWSKARREDFQKQLNIQVDPLTALNESFEQWGERRQFQRLRKQQLALEKTNSMRAAFNAYTNNLVFGETYVLTADQKDKSRLIRSYNQLPDVTSVIRSDLDLRDLHRNQVLTAMDDARQNCSFSCKAVALMDLSY